MKKFLYILSFLSLSPLFKSQTTTPVPAPDADNRKVRFGLRINPQPTWLSSGDKNNTPSGANFGFGFGLNVEFRFSDVVALLTGIGGDFEGGKYKFRNGAGYQPTYFLDPSNIMVAPKSNNPLTTLKNPDNTSYLLKERDLKTSYVTIPIILKLSTREYNGLKYFGMFGGEIGVRVNAQATDSYYSSTTYDVNGVGTTLAGAGSLSQINVNKDCSPVPLRVGLNVGAGGEYRLAGTTALFVSINYYRSFINAYRQQSNYMIYQAVAGPNNTEIYKFVQQNLMLSAIRINIGIMF
jgi:hypothetical protein